MTVPRFFKARSFDSAGSSKVIYSDPASQTHATGTGWVNVVSRALLVKELRTANYEVRMVVVSFDAYSSGSYGNELVRVTLNGDPLPDELKVPNGASGLPTVHFEITVPITNTSMANTIAIQDKGAGGQTLTIDDIRFDALIAMVTI